MLAIPSPLRIKRKLNRPSLLADLKNHKPKTTGFPGSSFAKAIADRQTSPC